MPKRAIFEKKNTLVIGGAGFLGSHLCDELIKTRKVICLDNFLTGEERNIDHLLADPNFEFVKHDINEPVDLENIPGLQKFKIEFQGIQEIYDLACPTSPASFQENRISTLLANSYGVRNSLELARKYEAKYMFFSSSVVYGPRRGNDRIQESDIGLVDFMGQRSSYDEGKRFAETMVSNYRDFYQMDAKIVRIFRTYGPRMPLGQGHMIPDFVDCALEGRELTIFGGRDFSSTLCYVSDVVDAVVKMMDTNIQGPVNIGSDVDINVTELAQKIIDIIGSESAIKHTDELLFMSQLAIPDTTMARNELAWIPVVTLSKGLEKTIEHLRASKGLIKRIGY